MNNHPPWRVKHNAHKYTNLQNKEPHLTQHLKPTGLINSDHAEQVTESIEMKGEIIVTITIVNNCFK